MTGITVYGIATCESCKKAMKALAAEGLAPVLRDVRAAPLSAAEIDEFVAAFGPDLVNRQSVTWRSISDFLRLAEPEAQIAAQPTLMKRPVIRSAAGLTLGWDEGVKAHHLAG